MAKIVVTKLANARKRKAGVKGSTIVEKRVRDDSGKLHIVRTIEGRSATFGDDLTYVFSRNVAKARRENKQVIGVLDRAPARD